MGCETAVHLWKQGHEVELVEMREELAPDAYRLHKRRLRFAQTVATLDAISPLRVLARGYAVATKGKRGAVVTDAAALKAGDTLHIRFAKGAADCRVTDTEEEA